MEAGRPPVQDVKGGIPKEAPSPTCPESAFWRDAGRGPCRGRVSAENLALWARMRGGRGPRGERPRPREGCVPACGALLPSTLKTAQKETWSTEVNSSRTGRDWPSGPAPSSFTPSPGGTRMWHSWFPRGLFSSLSPVQIPFFTPIGPQFPHCSSLVRNHPRPARLLSQSPFLQTGREHFPGRVCCPQVHRPHCPRPAAPGLPARSVGASLAMQIYAAPLPAPTASLLPQRSTFPFSPLCRQQPTLQTASDPLSQLGGSRAG